MASSFLLPKWLKIPGWILTLLGLVLIYLRFSAGIEPDFLEIKVFAIFSSYFDNKYLQVINNNIIEELAALSLILGLLLTAFTVDKKEDEKSLHIRARALFMAFYAEAVFLMLSIVFTYGMAFVYMMVLNLAFPLTAYILIHRGMLWLQKLRSRQSQSSIRKQFFENS